MSFILYLLTGVLVLGYVFIRKIYKFWTDRGFLSVEASFPFGNLRGVGTKFTSVEATDVLYKKYKGKAQALGIYFFTTPVILPLDPELYKNILVRDFSSFHDRSFHMNKEDQPVSAK